MMNPKVSFIVPCYNLAHLLPDCIESILAQSYGDFEVLIMDDCSPDGTPEVAQSFRDSRVQHRRNRTNLGNIQNYNKGIGLARGEHIWLISADDRLRRPYILDRYVALMDRHPEVGYAFCPAVAIDESGRETKFLNFSSLGEQDKVLRGHEFLKRLLRSDVVVAASGMARKECYDRLGYFPLDLPYSGDWYLWSLFAMHYDVAYFAEPMVNYRQHTLSMTSSLVNRDINICIANEITTLQRLEKKADAAGHTSLANLCHAELVARRIREGDQAHWRRDFSHALEHYRLALTLNPWMLGTWAKYLLLRTGRVGVYLRESRFGIRRLAHAIGSRHDPRHGAASRQVP